MEYYLLAFSAMAVAVILGCLFAKQAKKEEEARLRKTVKQMVQEELKERKNKE